MRFSLCQLLCCQLQLSAGAQNCRRTPSKRVLVSGQTEQWNTKISEANRVGMVCTRAPQKYFSSQSLKNLDRAPWIRNRSLASAEMIDDEGEKGIPGIVEKIEGIHSRGIDNKNIL